MPLRVRIDELRAKADLYAMADELREVFRINLSTVARYHLMSSNQVVQPGSFYWNDSRELSRNDKIVRDLIRLRLYRLSRSAGEQNRTMIVLSLNPRAGRTRSYLHCHWYWEEHMVRKHLSIADIEALQMKPYDAVSQGKRFGTYQVESRVYCMDGARRTGEAMAKLFSETYQQFLTV